MEIIFPTWLLLQCFARFAEERPQTRIELYESVLSGTEEALATAQGRSGHLLADAAWIRRRCADAVALHRRGASRSIRCTSSGAS